MQDLPEPYTLVGVAVLLISNVGLWIDKVYQGKKQLKKTNNNGTSLKDLHGKIDAIATSISTIDKNSAIAAIEIKNMKEVCENTRQRYEKRFEKLEEKP